MHSGFSSALSHGQRNISKLSILFNKTKFLSNVGKTVTPNTLVKNTNYGNSNLMVYFLLQSINTWARVLETFLMKIRGPWATSQFQSINTFFQIYDYTITLIKFESSSPKETLCQVCLELSQWFWRRTKDGQ